MAGNIGGNYIVQFSDKITVFLLEELIHVLHFTCVHITQCHTHVLSFLFCFGKSRLLLLSPFGLKTTTA